MTNFKYHEENLYQKFQIIEHFYCCIHHEVTDNGDRHSGDRHNGDHHGTPHICNYVLYKFDTNIHDL